MPPSGTGRSPNAQPQPPATRLVGLGRSPVSSLASVAIDEFSAVSRRLPIWQLYERARALGLTVQVSAQSWQGLGATEDERRRIVASAEGGIWLLRTSEPEPIASFAGTRRVVDTTRRLRRFPFWAHAGSSRLADVPVVDTTLIRTLDVGQVAYAYRAGVTFIQVKRLVGASPAVSGQAADQPASNSLGTPGDARRPRAESSRALPDVSPVLDAAFGPELA